MLQLLLIDVALAYHRSGDLFALLAQVLLFLWAFNTKVFFYYIKEILNLSLGNAALQALAGATLVAPLYELLGRRSVRRDIQAEFFPVKGQTGVTGFGYFVEYFTGTPAGAAALTEFHEVWKSLICTHSNPFSYHLYVI